jgi:hypothetical protein
MLYISTVFWFACGMLLTAEPGRLSPRVKRDLPQSTLGRMFLTWFTPGPGTGYMFVLTNMLALSVLLFLPYHWIGTLLRNAASSNTVGLGVGIPLGAMQKWTEPFDFLCAAFVAMSYLAIYLGIGSLIVRWLRRHIEVRLALPIVINVIILMFGCIAPWVIQMTSPAIRNNDWTMLQITNAVWTLGEACFESTLPNLEIVLLTLGGAALFVWSLNLLPLLDELRQVRITAPQRVQEEEAAIAADLAEPPGPKDPWDDGAE